MAETFHVLAVLDGNRRYAKKQEWQNLWEGHRAGYETFRQILKSIWTYDVTHFSAWVLSMNNVLNRPKTELQFLYHLLDHAFDEVALELEKNQNDIQFYAVGEWQEFLPDTLCARIVSLQNSTAHCRKKVLTLLLAYDGKKDLMNAINRSLFPASISRAMILPNITPLITEKLIKKYLSTGHLPDIDLMIRTGGEPHLSEGLPLWQMANAHLYFTETLWPEFTETELAKAIQEFKSRERRLGA